MFLTDPGSMTVQLRAHPCELIDSIRRRILLDVAKVDAQQLLVYWEAYSKANPNCLDYKWIIDRIPDEYKNLDNSKKENIKMETTKLYDYKELVQYDAESEALCLEKDFPNALSFLAYALNKHEENISSDDVPVIIHSSEVNEKALYTMFNMAVVAGYNMAVKEERNENPSEL